MFDFWLLLNMIQVKSCDSIDRKRERTDNLGKTELKNVKREVGYVEGGFRHGSASFVKEARKSTVRKLVCS